MAILTARAYLPRHRLDRAAAGIGRGTRAVASFDEDPTSMGVEAARRVLAGEHHPVDAVVFTTTAPPYADRTNATAIHQALALDRSVAAYDSIGSMRTAVGALLAALDGAAAGRRTLLVAADVRVGLPGSIDERDGGDGAAAVLVGPGTASAELVASASASAEFLDRWRVPGEPTSNVWEERFGETEYLPLAEAALGDALKAAGLSAGEVDHLVVTGLHTRAVGMARKAAGVRADAVVDDLLGSIGVTGAAHPLLLLTDVLERARPGEVVLLLVLADGADCLVLRTGSAVGRADGAVTVAAQLPGRAVAYDDALVWRGLLKRAAPRRPDPDRPAAPPSSRNAPWKFALVGSRCTDCGTRHLPPERICLECRSVDRMAPEPLAHLQGTITTFAVDHLAFSVAPPVVAAVVDLDGGGRIQCELADVVPDQVRIGGRVEMTFRRLYTTADGVHNYFWKARPIEQGAG
jgi:3-hydroxy-3-methylglutaryl CoA synthase/uncharacterized OB-fold protein